MTRIYNKHIKILSEQLINYIDSSIHPDKYWEFSRLFYPYMKSYSTDNMGHIQRKITKSNIVIDTKLMNIVFRIKRRDAKRIDFFPYNRRQYVVSLKKVWSKTQEPFFESKTLNSSEDSLIKKTIHFSSISHKDIKKFELTYFLKMMFKLNSTIPYKIEKFLFEETG